MFKNFATPLAYFATVARLHSVRGAAEMLRIAPSALSRQMRQIEERAGLPLFERVPRGVNLTPAGEILYAYVQRWEKDFGSLTDDLDSLAGLRVGTVTVSTVEIATYGVVPRAVHALREKLPGVSVHLKVGHIDTVLRDMAEGKAEIGILINMPKAAGVRAAWSVRTAMGAVVPPDHPLAGSRELRMADCLAYPIVMPDDTLMASSAIRQALERTRRGVRVAATCNRIASLKALVKAGVGLTFLALLDVVPETAAGELRFIKLKDRDIEAPHISLVVAKHGKLSPAALALLDLLRHELEKDGNEPGNGERRPAGRRVRKPA